jgi:iron complex transport system substrate-binding protein
MRRLCWLRRTMIACTLWGFGTHSASAGAAQRIITLAPHLAELVCVASSCERLVAVSRYTDPRFSQGKPEIGDAFTISIEAIMALKPDLILAWEGGTPAPLVAQLRRTGLPVQTVRAHTLSDIGHGIRTVGKLTGTSAKADAAARQFEKRLGLLQKTYQQRLPVRVFYQIGLNPMYTIGQRSPIHEAILLCGGRNAFANVPQTATLASLESVAATAPQIIVFERSAQSAAIENYWRRWPLIRAVAHKQLYPIDGRLTRPAPSMLYGLESLCKVIETARGHYR